MKAFHVRAPYSTWPKAALPHLLVTGGKSLKYNRGAQDVFLAVVSQWQASSLVVSRWPRNEDLPLAAAFQKMEGGKVKLQRTSTRMEQFLCTLCAF